MVQIGARNREVLSDNNTNPVNISNLMGKVRTIMSVLFSFSSITQWSKTLISVLKYFTFMNLLTYLVYDHDESFNIDSLKAFKSFKVYRYHYSGVCENCMVGM